MLVKAKTKVKAERWRLRALAEPGNVVGRGSWSPRSGENNMKARTAIKIGGYALPGTR